MTLEDAYAAYHKWAVKKVASWLITSGQPVDAADDIVQEAFVSLVRTQQDDLHHPAPLIERACKNRFLDWNRDRERTKRDTRKSVSIQKLQSDQPGWDRPCPMADTETSALCRVEIAERLKGVTPHTARLMVRRVVDPTITPNEERYVRKVALYRLKKKERAA